MVVGCSSGVRGRPLQAQRVSAQVIVRGGPVSGRVTVDDGYSSYRRPMRPVAVQRYVPRVARDERFVTIMSGIGDLTDTGKWSSTTSTAATSTKSAGTTRGV